MLIIKNVRILDGENMSELCDIQIIDGKIAAISRGVFDDGPIHSELSSVAEKPKVFDGQGRICLPGLIDSHSHAAAAVFDPEIQLALLRQGVTTVIVGQDGIGFAPSDNNSLAWSENYFAGIDGSAIQITAGSMANWLAAYDEATALNVAALVPHGSLRYLVAHTKSEPLNETEIAEMGQLMATAFQEGAVGFSTGLEYVPAAWADNAELIALLKITAKYDRVHNTHMRGYEDKAPTAMAEQIELAHLSGVTTNITHYHGDAKVLGQLLDDAANANVPMTFDSYPYLKGCSLLAMVSLPTWLPLANPTKTLELITNNQATNQRLADHLATLDDLWPRTTMAWAQGTDPITGKEWDWVAGLTIPEIAQRLGTTNSDATLRLLVGTKLRASCVFAQPPTNSAESVSTLADRPGHMAGSDGIFVPFAPAPTHHSRNHPRGWGAATRWLTTKVLTGEWTWAEAVEHLSARAAERYGLGGRGQLAIGAPADLI